MVNFYNKRELLKTSLKEYLVAARYCLSYDKKKDIFWGHSGCLGFPGALLLISLADSMGYYVERGGDNTKTHLQILKNSEWYNQKLEVDDIEKIYKFYRNPLAHNTGIGNDTRIKLDYSSNIIYEKTEGIPTLNLAAFLVLSDKMVDKFISSINSLVKE
jgi:hypothetical protein